ncbi:MAG: UDP-N-acetylmuramoylalanine--D-glutamate ligase [Candidatus Melainabacteria bacterium GWF2_37_15]|nr:MAG: UDP-N-acetylmuramoylalanine--D-glutamate ligase [Candidatus Melainabacteria bacterium GWF2_37_15]
MKRKWLNFDVTILGLSKSGISAAKYLADKGANCTISEKRESTPEDQEKIKELEDLGIKVEMGSNKPETIMHSDVIITSPGIPPHSEVMQLIKSHNIECIGELELAYRETGKPFIAITGTNGKTTTTKLVSEILTKGGFKAPACGNIGIPATEFIDKDMDFFVAEVSSFQIATSKTFKPQIAVFLNYTPDHIDWHGDEEEYFRVKASLFTERQPAWAVLNAKSLKIAYLKLDIPSETWFFNRESEDKSVFCSDGKIFLKDEEKKVHEIMELSEVPLKGKHNLENVMAAITVAHIVGVNHEVIKQAIMEFTPPEHRLEFVAEINGVEYYNDSKGTNCDSTICALRAFETQKVVLIAGGRDKGTDLTEFAREVKKRAAAVILIGEAADRFDLALKKEGMENIYREKTFEAAIDKAGELKLGPVLLSPACASFDMFKNFEERGKVFKEYVLKKKTVRSC